MKSLLSRIKESIIKVIKSIDAILSAEEEKERESLKGMTDEQRSDYYFKKYHGSLWKKRT